MRDIVSRFAQIFHISPVAVPIFMGRITAILAPTPFTIRNTHNGYHNCVRYNFGRKYRFQITVIVPVLQRADIREPFSSDRVSIDRSLATAVMRCYPRKPVMRCMYVPRRAVRCGAREVHTRERIPASEILTTACALRAYII